ncbi:hypothetical protein, partial [Amphritea sp.]|uniref:hypothetical protein n=1 Tax=Amphritea sp. TaxID=1872502 RepID=UPI003D0C4C27
MKPELYSIYIATMLLTSTVATPSFASPTTEDIPAGVSQTEGLYAGTFFCSSGEMGITMSLKDQGVANPDKSDIHKRLIG